MINEISVQEIVELADVNRSTFYLHYNDVYDLQDKIESDIFAEISDIISLISPLELAENPLRLLTSLFHYFNDNSEICVVLLSKTGSITTGKRISRMIEGKFKNEWKSLTIGMSAREAHYYSLFVISGFVGILQGWIEAGRSEAPGEIAAIALNYIVSSKKGIPLGTMESPLIAERAELAQSGIDGNSTDGNSSGGEGRLSREQGSTE
ncbi:TetR-like C-terminal domain-containing protein [Paenibacillus thiaminolyticus]|nr:TetR-like C-terminal domain-containing protein [Paenibacillus thiaminolyticus]